MEPWTIHILVPASTLHTVLGAGPALGSPMYAMHTACLVVPPINVLATVSL